MTTHEHPSKSTPEKKPAQDEVTRKAYLSIAIDEVKPCFPQFLAGTGRYDDHVGPFAIGIFTSIL